MSHDTFQVFMSSPGYSGIELASCKRVLDDLISEDFRFGTLSWISTTASEWGRSQLVIDRELDECDVFILAMDDDWVRDVHPHSTPINEVIRRAQMKRSGMRKAPEILVFFKQIAPQVMVDPGPRLAKALDFRKSLEESDLVQCCTYANDDEFTTQLYHRLKEFAEVKLPQKDISRESRILGGALRFGKSDSGEGKLFMPGAKAPPDLPSEEVLELQLPQKSRFFNAGIENAELPLVVGQTYRFYTSIGRRRSDTLGGGEFHEPDWGRHEFLDLLFVVEGAGLSFTPQSQPVRLHKTLDLNPVYFDLVARKAGFLKAFVSIFLSRELTLLGEYLIALEVVTAESEVAR